MSPKDPREKKTLVIDMAEHSRGPHWLSKPKPTPLRTPDEQAILDMIARDRGQAYVDEWAESILAQARAIGDLEEKKEKEQ